MTAFELAIRQTIKIYQAGVEGAPVPYFPGMRVADVERTYTEGRLDALAEIDKIEIPPATRFFKIKISAKTEADVAAIRAARAHKQ